MSFKDVLTNVKFTKISQLNVKRCVLKKINLSLIISFLVYTSLFPILFKYTIATHSNYYFYDSEESHISKIITKNKLLVRLKFMFSFALGKPGYLLQQLH